jgi:deoxyribonuclease-4
MAQMARTAVDVGCETVQIFSRSPRGGKAKELCPADVDKMKEILKSNDIYPLVIHAPYFVNLASNDESKRQYSIQVLVEELKRAEFLGAEYVITHTGHREKDEEDDSPQALARVLESVMDILGEYDGKVRLLLENTAGQGRQIGNSLESLAALLSQIPEKRTGVCLDTCHAFSAGYDLSSEKPVSQFLTEFDKIIGMSRLFAVHLNDSREKLGLRIDRHAHLGQGEIGDQGIKAFITSPLLPPDIPGLLETPTDSEHADKDNVAHAKKLRGNFRA